MRAKCTRGFGIITDPETGEEINAEDTFEVSEEAFNRLKDTYSGIEAVSSGEEPTDESTPTEEQSAETETFRCGVNDCSREVDSPEESCWQHSDD